MPCPMRVVLVTVSLVVAGIVAFYCSEPSASDATEQEKKKGGAQQDEQQTSGVRCRRAALLAGTRQFAIVARSRSAHS